MFRNLSARMFANTAYYTINALSLAHISAQNTGRHHKIIARVLFTPITDCSSVFVYLDTEGRDWPSETKTDQFYKIPGFGGASPGPAGATSEFYPGILWKENENLHIYIRNESIQKCVFQMSIEGVLEMISNKDVM